MTICRRLPKIFNESFIELKIVSIYMILKVLNLKSFDHSVFGHVETKSPQNIGIVFAGKAQKLKN